MRFSDQATPSAVRNSIDATSGLVSMVGGPPGLLPRPTPNTTPRAAVRGARRSSRATSLVGASATTW